MSKNPRHPEIPEYKEQGILIDCIQCTLINNEIRSDCPECHGKKSYFIPAQLLDRFSSQKHVLNNLLAKKDEIDKYFTNRMDLDENQRKLIKESFLGLLKNQMIYNFDLKDFLVDAIKDLDKN